jgi:hypothetical protein
MAVDREIEAMAAFVQELGALGIDSLDQAIFVTDKTNEWLERGSGHLDPRLRRAIEAALEAGDVEFGGQFRSSYFDAHKALQDQRHLSANEATAVLGRLRVIAVLATHSHMSAARIAAALGAGIDWQEVEVALKVMGLERRYEESQAMEVVDSDFLGAEREFADADLAGAAEIVGEAAPKLGFAGDLTRMLLDLVSGSAHVPYLQMLYALALTSEFYEHIPAALYEFNPRSGRVDRILRRVFEEVATAGNPFLNNAKSVAVLDRNWARAKDTPQLRQATALVDIVVGLGKLSFTPQKELAALLRRFVMRFVQIAKSPATILPPITEVEARRVLREIGASPTETQGILEQRFLDAYAYVEYSRLDDWRFRGLGDSVNATNLSKKKLGDLDLQDSMNRRIVAFEAHAGTLRRAYFESHRRTLEKSLEQRVKELESIADPSEWTVQVHFIAHGFEMDIPTPEVICGVRVEYAFQTFEEVLGRLDPSDNPVLSAIEEHAVNPLRERKTPDRVRRKLLALMGLSTTTQ